MSINTLTNLAAARRPDTVPLGTFPKGLTEVAHFATTKPIIAATKAAGAPPPSTSADGTSPTSTIDTALNLLFGYIPTEVLTLYVAVLAALQQPSKYPSATWIVFWSFFAATPAVVWLVYGAKVKAMNKPLPIGFGAWPVWEMSAATIAYSAWALALPNSPFAKFDWYSSALSGVVVLVASTLLGLLAPFFQRKLAVGT
jgi:hypothetical protein